MKIEKLAVPFIVCPVCKRKFIRTSSIAIIDKNIVTHASYKCSMKYLMDENNKLPENDRERMSFFDVSYRFTENYATSDKIVSEDEIAEYKKRFFKVFLKTDSIIVKKTVRDRIWEHTGKKYLRELQYLHMLNRIYEQHKDKWRSGFKLTFIPSVIEQFKSKGYLSKNQWEIIERLVDEHMTAADREYFYKAKQRASDMSTVELPDMLRYMQRKHSFIEWYNKKNGLAEETE